MAVEVFVIQTFPFIPTNLNSCWPCGGKHSVELIHLGTSVFTCRVVS